jgi:hypothetical protein
LGPIEVGDRLLGELLEGNVDRTRQVLLLELAGRQHLEHEGIAFSHEALDPLDVDLPRHGITLRERNAKAELDHSCPVGEDS